MAAIARESSGIMHHLRRPVPAAPHRGRGRQEVAVSPRGARLASPARPRGRDRRAVAGLGAPHVPGARLLMLIAIVFATFVQVPTYSAGTGVVVYQGALVTAPSPGTVDTIYVQSGQLVHKDDVLVKLSVGEGRCRPRDRHPGAREGRAGLPVRRGGRDLAQAACRGAAAGAARAGAVDQRRSSAAGR